MAKASKRSRDTDGEGGAEKKLRAAPAEKAGEEGAGGRMTKEETKAITAARGGGARGCLLLHALRGLAAAALGRRAARAPPTHRHHGARRHLRLELRDSRAGSHELAP